MRSSIIVQQRSENGYGFQRPGLKTGWENGIFWSEIGSGFGEPGDTPLTKVKLTKIRTVEPLLADTALIRTS